MQVFHADILNLLSMADMWRSRAPPTPLDFDKIREGTFSLHRPQQNGVHANGSAASNGKPGQASGSGSASTEKLLNGSSSSSGSASGAGLKDQRELSLQDNLELFIARYGSCLRLQV